MSTFTTSKKINDHLTAKMLDRGCTFYRGSQHEYFKDKDGNYTSYPPGFIRGAGTCTVSVQGHNGWHQRDFSHPYSTAAENWAVKTAQEVLSEQPATAEKS